MPKLKGSRLMSILKGEYERIIPGEAMVVCFTHGAVTLAEELARQGFMTEGQAKYIGTKIVPELVWPGINKEKARRKGTA